MLAKAIEDGKLLTAEDVEHLMALFETSSLGAFGTLNLKLPSSGQICIQYTKASQQHHLKSRILYDCLPDINCLPSQIQDLPIIEMHVLTVCIFSSSCLGSLKFIPPCL